MAPPRYPPPHVGGGVIVLPMIDLPNCTSLNPERSQDALIIGAISAGFALFILIVPRMCHWPFVSLAINLGLIGLFMATIPDFCTSNPPSHVSYFDGNNTSTIAFFAMLLSLFGMLFPCLKCLMCPMPRAPMQHRPIELVKNDGITLV